MKRKQLIDDIAYIKSIISCSLHYTNLSGIAAVISGIATWIGSLYCFIRLPKPVPGNLWKTEITIEFIGIWLIIFLVSAIAHVYFIIRKARRHGEPAWSRLARLVVYALSPALLIGAFVTIFLIQKSQFIYIPSLWMIAYGLGVWSSGLFSIPEPRWLGASFMVSGLLTLFFWIDYSLVMLAISYGGYHIVYGLRLIFRYGGE